MVVRMEGHVSGWVQGVGFRWSMLYEAQRLGLGGWCRNVDDRVEFAVEGEETAVAEMLRWLEHGPRWARVDAVQTHWVSPVGERAFRVR